MKKRGKFIVIEGTDACGKGTLVEKLKELYPDVYFTREPGGTAIGEKVRDLILDKNNKMYPLTEAYLYAASRSEFAKKIAVMLEEGIDVVSERYVYSSYVYQGYAGDLGLDKVLEINKPIIRDLKEDQLIILDMDINDYRSRLSNRGEADRIEMRDDEYFAKVIDGYKKIEELIDGIDNLLYVNTSKNSPEEVFEKVKKQIIL